MARETNNYVFTYLQCQGLTELPDKEMCWEISIEAWEDDTANPLKLFVDDTLVGQYTVGSPEVRLIKELYDNYIPLQRHIWHVNYTGTLHLRGRTGDAVVASDFLVDCFCTLDRNPTSEQIDLNAFHGKALGIYADNCTHLSLDGFCPEQRGNFLCFHTPQFIRDQNLAVNGYYNIHRLRTLKTDAKHIVVWYCLSFSRKRVLLCNHLLQIPSKTSLNFLKLFWRK